LLDSLLQEKKIHLVQRNKWLFLGAGVALRAMKVRKAEAAAVAVAVADLTGLGQEVEEERGPTAVHYPLIWKVTDYMLPT